MNEQRRGATLTSTRSLSIARRWLVATFAGVTWRWVGVFCLVILPFAFSRPNVRVALMSGAGFLPFAKALSFAYLLAFLKLAPVPLAVIVAVNRTHSSHRRWLAGVVVALVGGAIVGTALLYLAMSRLMPDSRVFLAMTRGTAAENASRFVGLTLMDLVMCAAALAFVYYLKRSAATAADLQREEQRRAEVERESAEASLALMQAQIEPHFLFNSLASIRRLYETEPQKGRTMLRHLSSYLAASLPSLRDARSTLGRELTLAVAYLNVQKIRMGSRLRVELDVAPGLHALAVPPMMLATLVENAVLHGISPLPKGGTVRIGARISADNLILDVVDTGRGLQETWGAGIGLANIQARLKSEFGDGAALDLRNAPEGGVAASLVLPVYHPPAVAA